MKKIISNTYIIDGICKILNRTELGFPSWSAILRWSQDLFIDHIIRTEQIENYDYEREIIEIENRFYLIFNDEDYEKAILLLSRENRWIMQNQQK